MPVDYDCYEMAEVPDEEVQRYELENNMTKEDLEQMMDIKDDVIYDTNANYRNCHT
jgi:hypothetical protein